MFTYYKQINKKKKQIFLKLMEMYFFFLNCFYNLFLYYLKGVQSYQVILQAEDC